LAAETQRAQLRECAAGHGLSLAHNGTPHSCSLTVPWWDGERIGRAKVRKLMG